MARWVVGIVALIFLVGGFGIGIVVADSTSSQMDNPEGAHTLSEPPEGPHVVIEIRPTTEGHAEWSIQYRFNVSTETQAEAFNELAEEVIEGDRTLELDRSTVEGFRDQSIASTDRHMEILNAQWSAEVEGDIGTLSFEFTWTNFITRSDERVYLDDVFRTADGTWLSNLDEGVRLAIVTPEEYVIDEAPASATQDDRGLIFDGPMQLDRGDLTVVYSDTTFVDDGLPWQMFAFFLAVIAVTGLMIAAGYRQSSRTHGSPVADAEGHPGDPLDEIDEELLSDTERVERLLRENGGRMKQASIVEETDWSNAKVSQLLSEMAEEGRVEKLRIGQENLISLPEYAAE